MMNSITFRYILFSVITLLLSTKMQAQSNDYFSHGESWAVESASVTHYESSYVEQQGDTIINGDTLVKLVRVARPYMGSNVRRYFLAKNNLGVLHLYYSNINYSVLSDSIIMDYSRTDSISYINTNGTYSARAIIAIDTIIFAGVPKKVFRFDDGGCLGPATNGDLVYEGVFSHYITPFFPDCFENAEVLTCYSIHDTMYTVQNSSFTVRPSGMCYLMHINTEEIKPIAFNIYPNPASHTLYIDIDKPIENIHIYNNLGQLILEGTTQEIDVSTLINGMYTIKIALESGAIINQQFVVQH